MNDRRATGGFTLLELMVTIAVLGILASLAIAAFSRFQTRARQTEAKLNLKAFYTSVYASHAETSSYACGLCGWSLEDNTVYHYYLSATDTEETGRRGCTQADGGVVAAAQTDNAFTASAAGNLDTDDTCDGWNIDDSNNLTNVQSDVEN